MISNRLESTNSLTWWRRIWGSTRPARCETSTKRCLLRSRNSAHSPALSKSISLKGRLKRISSSSLAVPRRSCKPTVFRTRAMALKVRASSTRCSSYRSCSIRSRRSCKRALDLVRLSLSWVMSQRKKTQEMTALMSRLFTTSASANPALSINQATARRKKVQTWLFIDLRSSACWSHKMSTPPSS